MRIEKENGIITLMRGDSLSTPIYINEGTKLDPKIRPLKDSERLYFGLMEPGKAFEDAIVKKVYSASSPTDDEGNTLLILTPKDTEYLLTGKYYYMIKHRSIDEWGDEWVRTIVSPTIFWLEGNNPEPDEVEYYEKDKYNVQTVILEGGEIVMPEDEITDDAIIEEGGEII